MTGRPRFGGWRFWPAALLWLPAGLVVQAFLRFAPEAASGEGSAGLWPAILPMALVSLALAAPCGLPLALGCRRLWRRGYRRGAWVAGLVLAALTLGATVFAGLLGPLAVALAAVLLSLPVWIAALWLARRE